MKKQFIFLPFFLFCAFATFAQVSGIGFRPTMTLSRYKLNTDMNDLYDATLRPGLGLGAFMEINLGNRFTLQPEVNFTQRGANIVSESTIYWDGPSFGYPFSHKVTDHRQKETLNYIDIPMMVEKNFGGGRFGAYVAAGPALSFAINGRGKEEITTEYTATEGAVNTNTDRLDYAIEMGSGRNDTYKGFDFSLNVGSGLIYLLDNGEISLDLRYTHGLRGLEVGGLKNRNFLVGISYMFYLGQ